MKTHIKSFLVLAIAMLCLSCVETDDLVTPNVASPVLVLLEGTAFPPTSPVRVNSIFLELDKSNILDHTKGIDSIPVSNLAIRVFMANTTEVAAFTTDIAGSAELVLSWQELGLAQPVSGSQVRLEFTGTHKGVAFRKYHTVRVQ